MNESERKAVHELTDDELRREIAAALGYTIETHPQYKRWSRVIDPNGAPVRSDRNKDGWIPTEYLWGYDCLYPNWPTDDGAAFRLVRDVLDRLNKEKYGYWAFEMGSLYVYIHQIANGADAWNMSADARDARALSELAALALRQMGGAE